MYNNSSQYPSGSYQSSYPQYQPPPPQQQQQQEYNYNYQGYPHYDQIQTVVSNAGFQPLNNWSNAGYTATTDPVAQEMQQQKAQLAKQREDYVKKVSVLRHELEQLRVQKQQLASEGRSSDRDLGNIVKQNDKLQEEIVGKMKAILNVIEMLSSIIKDGKSADDLEASLPGNEGGKSNAALAVDQVTQHKRNHQDEAAEAKSSKYCYIHYDTGLHWCRSCDDFPETAKDFLLHLQERKHHESAKENDVDNTPWHKLPAEEVLPTDEDLPKKRVPIKGLQFFISAPSWYCKLCDVWIGDLHCASHHLKSVAHYNNYENFIAQNPHWEMEWLKDREKSKSRKGLQTSSDSDNAKKKKRKRHALENLLLKEKKKKKRSKKKRRQSSESSSSSSSSDSSSDDNNDRSKSIRVAMRNMKQVQSIMDEDLSSKWTVLERLVEEHKKKEKEAQERKDKEEKRDDPLINQWMTVSQPQDKDKVLLEGLKDRMRQKQDLEKVKAAEMERKRLEKEQAERDMQDRKQKALKFAQEAEERERQRREHEEMERIKNRDHVRFKANYRRKKSPQGDEDDYERYGRERHRSDRDGGLHSSRRSKSRSKSVDRKSDEYGDKKKFQGPSSNKKLPFIGRMPLFKNKKPQDDREEKKEIKKESYETPRRTRFQPGNLAKAFIPRPEVVCFPKLSSIPPLTLPPPPTIAEEPKAPKAPKIPKEPQPPPPPKIEHKEDQPANLSDDEVLYADHGEGINPSMMGQYYQDYNMMYSNDYSYSQDEAAPPHSFTMPLEPPPLPPDDDLAMLGICADDMAAQTF